MHCISNKKSFHKTDAFKNSKKKNEINLCYNCSFKIQQIFKNSKTESYINIHLINAVLKYNRAFIKIILKKNPINSLFKHKRVTQTRIDLKNKESLSEVNRYDQIKV